MKLKSTFISLFTAVMLGGIMLAPISVGAQNDESRHRQKKKNEWRNIGAGSAAVGLLGLLKGDKTLLFAGAAGALYSANRYEQDRKSQAKSDRARAAYFNKRSFTRNGHRYVRKTVYKNGKKYYQFVRA